MSQDLQRQIDQILQKLREIEKRLAAVERGEWK
jgi:hypothetical protein